MREKFSPDSGLEFECVSSRRCALVSKGSLKSVLHKANWV